MTMLDDDRLASLLARAGEAFEVPADGPGDILARAAGRGPGTGDGAPAGRRDARSGRRGPDGTAPRAGRRRARAAHRRSGGAAPRALGGRLHRRRPRAGRGDRRAGGPPVAPDAHLGPAHVARRGSGRADRPPSRPASPASGSATSGGTASVPGATTQHAGLAAPAPVTTPNSPTTPALPSGAVGQSARIEQTGSLGLTVGRGDLNRTVTQLTNLAGAYGGFVANSQTQSGAASGGPPSGSVTLQVPVGNFATVLKRAEALGKTSDLTTKATDVTGQYVDLQARITALEASRQQYLTILAKATTVGDILSVQEQLDGIQQQIEELQGQLQLLTSETSYSTLTVSVSERQPAPPPSPLPESGLVRAWHASVGGFVAGVEGVIRVAGPLLFALLLLAAVAFGGRALWRRVQRHRL